MVVAYHFYADLRTSRRRLDTRLTQDKERCSHRHRRVALKVSPRHHDTPRRMLTFIGAVSYQPREYADDRSVEWAISQWSNRCCFRSASTGRIHRLHILGMQDFRKTVLSLRPTN
jgi:hypothetical protein